MIVLDASVILAAILGESGGDDVFDQLDDAMISTVSVAEVYSYAAVNALPTAAIDAFFADTGIHIRPFELKEAVIAGQIASATRKARLSLGDRSCLALAKCHAAAVLTADRPWQLVAEDVGVQVTLLR